MVKSITKKNKNIKNKSKKKYSSAKLDIKKISKGYFFYGAKKYSGEQLLEHSKTTERINNDPCSFENISWFGDYEQAKIYKTKELHIYKWKIKKDTNLIIINKNNENFIKELFRNNSTKILNTALNIDISKKEKEKIQQKLTESNITHDYLDMTQNERAYYEFAFAYGYLKIEDQYQFMKLMQFLIQNKVIDIQMRGGSSIITKLTQKINYYYLLNKTNTKLKYNRLSIYYLDKYALNNLCKLLPPKYKIEGVLQKNEKSFWFPNLIIYKMNIKEYVLFNPHHNLTYEDIVE